MKGVSLRWWSNVHYWTNKQDCLLYVGRALETRAHVHTHTHTQIWSSNSSATAVHTPKQSPSLWIIIHLHMKPQFSNLCTRHICFQWTFTLQKHICLWAEMLSRSPVDQKNFWPKSNINSETSMRGKKCQKEKQRWWDTVTFKSSCPLYHVANFTSRPQTTLHSLCAENHYVNSQSHTGFRARPGSVES